MITKNKIDKSIQIFLKSCIEIIVDIQALQERNEDFYTTYCSQCHGVTKNYPCVCVDGITPIEIHNYRSKNTKKIIKPPFNSKDLDILHNITELIQKLSQNILENHKNNPSNLLRIASQKTRAEWREPNKEERDWLDTQIDKAERKNQNLKKWYSESESRRAYMQYRFYNR